MRRQQVLRAISGYIVGIVAGWMHIGVLTALHRASHIASPMGVVSLTPGVIVAYLSLGGVLGILYALLFSPTPEGYAESLMNGLVYGVLGWVLFALSLIPVMTGEGPQWHIAQVADMLPALAGFLVQGVAIALLYHALFAGVARRAVAVGGATTATSPATARRIVIVGGGFAGVTTARHLEHLFARDESVAITLISKTNYLLFTPMLSEVTAGDVEAQHISTPLRAFFRRTRVVRGEVRSADLTRKVVWVASGATGAEFAVPFDHLVLAVGAVPRFPDHPGIAQRAFTFKSLQDAVRLRNHVIGMLERADAEPDPQRRKALLRFVVAGGGFAGAELIGGLNDFVRGALGFYTNLSPEDVSLVLVHPGERILPELSPELAAYAAERLQARGVTLRLGVRVCDVVPEGVVLNDGETLATETLIWAAGNRPHPLIQHLGLPTNPRGAAKVEPTLQVEGHANVWAIGDCAAVPDARTGALAPATAQHAERQAAVLAHNLHAILRGRRGKPKLKAFQHRSRGSLAVLGYQTAVAEVYGLKFSGLLAWWLWRAVYLTKLPSLEKKIRVALDWTVNLFFPRDIVQTMEAVSPAAVWEDKRLLTREVPLAEVSE